MDRLLENDLAVKLVSLLLALILWLQVSREAPESQRSIPGVPVQVRDLERRLEATELSPATVTVVVRGRGRSFAALTKDDFVAYVDLGAARPGRVSYRIDRVTVPKGVTLVGFSPEEVSVTVEPVAEREVAVAVRLEGQPAEGFLAGRPQAVPAEVVVRGRESLLATLGGAEVSVPVAGARETVSARRPVRLLDTRGQPLSGLAVTPEEVAVTVPVGEAAARRALPVRPVVTGQPAPGYAVLRVEAAPDTVTALGPDAAAGGPDAVPTEAVSVDGARRDVRRTVRLAPPAGVSVEGPGTVEVVVRVGPAAR